jgi:hypothetical protein
LSNTHAYCIGETRGIHNTKARKKKPKKKVASKRDRSGISWRRQSVEDTRRHWHHPTVDPIPHRAWPEKAKCDCHARQRAKDSLVCVGHAPDINDRRSLCFRRLERKTTENVTKGRVSWKKQRRCVDLAPKVEEKLMKNWPKNHH